MLRARTQWIALCAVTTTVLIGCGGGGGGGLPDPGLSNVNVEVASARGALITPDGGTITATSSDGTVYTLVIPAGALQKDTQIGMYPVKTITNLPSGAALSAAVHFTPEGLNLLAPAKLTIQVPSGTDTSKLIGFAYSGNGAGQQRYPALISGQTATISVLHFSGAGLGNRKLLDLLDNGFVQSFENRMEDAFIDAGTAGDPRPSYQTILKDWYAQIVKPALIAGAAPGAGDNQFILGFLQYNAWLDALLFAQLSSHDSTFTVEPQLTESRTLAVAMLKFRYDQENNLCIAKKTNPINGDVDNDPVTFADNAFSTAHDFTRRWNLDATANHLDDQSLLDNLCVKVVIDPGRTYSGSKPGDVGTLKVNAGFSVAGDPVRHDVPIRLKVSGDGTASPSNGLTDANGDFHATIPWPAGVDPIKINILGTIEEPNRFDRHISRFDRITKSVGAGVASIRIIPDVTGGTPGESSIFTAIAKDRNGNPVSVDPNLWGWGISPASVASIVPHGQTATVTAISPGVASVAVALGGTNVSATAEFQVKNPFSFFLANPWLHAVPPCNAIGMRVATDAFQPVDVTITASLGTISNVQQIAGFGTQFIFHSPSAGPVTITATSVADPTKHVSLNIAIDPLVGQFSDNISGIGLRIVRGDDVAGLTSSRYHLQLLNSGGSPTDEWVLAPSGSGFVGTNSVGHPISVSIGHAADLPGFLVALVQPGGQKLLEHSCP